MIQVRGIIIVILGIVLGGGLNAQTLNFKKFSIKNGLPSNVVYEIKQDKQGYIWFGTENGVCRYDGQEFQVFTKESGLSANEILKVHVAPDGKVYFLELGGGVARYVDGVVSSVPMTKGLDKAKNFHRNIFLDSPEGVVIGGMNVRDSLYVREEFKDYDYTQVYTYGKKGDRLIFATNGISKQAFTEHIHRCADPAFTFTGIEEYVRLIARSYEFFGDAFKSTDNVLWMDRESRSRKLFDGVMKDCGVKLPHHLNRVSDTEFYVSCQEGVLYVKHEGEKIKNYLWLITGEVAVYSFVDRNGGLWVATHGNGLYYAPNPNIHVLREARGEIFSDNVREIYKDDKGLYISYYKNQLEVKRGEKQISCELKDPKGKKFFITRFLPFEDKLGFVSNSFPVGFIDERGKLDILKLERIKEFTDVPKSFYYEKKGDYYYFAGFNYHFEKKNGKMEAFRSEAKDIPAGEIIRYKNDLWLAQEDGVMILRDGEKISLLDDEASLAGLVHDFEIGEDSTLWIGTEKNGLVSYRDGKIAVYNAENGYSIGNVKKVICESESILWTFSSNGLHRITLKNGTSDNVRTFNEDNGLSTNAITGMTYDQDTLWLSTQSGINYVDVRTLRQSIEEINCEINSVKVNGEYRPLNSEYQLEASQRSVEVTFSAPIFDNGGKINYEYRLLSDSEDWKPIKKNVLEFPVIPIGENRIEIKAKAEGYGDSKISSITFYVSPPFYQSWWFYLLTALALVGSSFLVFSYLYGRKLKRKNAITELELRNLRSQMNPHFIFNGLLSVQNSLRKRNLDRGLAYLVQFSKLMRHILESSREEYVELEAEMNVLDFYLKLESEKAEGSFEYSIHIDQEVIDEEVMVPPMIIQPFIENSILHGVIPLKDRRGKIDIRVSTRNEKTVLITVDDNGIGREAAKKRNTVRGKHKSVGIANTVERVQMILGKKEEVIRYTDLHDEQNNPRGTRVEVVVPFIGWE